MALSRGVAVRPHVVNLNLIPLEMRRAQNTTASLLLLATLLAGALLLPRFYNAFADNSSYVTDLQAQLRVTKSLTERETARLSAEKAAAAKLDPELKRMREETANTRPMPLSRVTRHVVLMPLADLALGTQPDGLRLVSITWQDPALTLQGRAASPQLVMAYAERLRASGRFTRVAPSLVDEVVDKNQPQLAAAPAEAAPASREYVFKLDLEAIGGEGP